ncbi:MAG: nitrogenase [Treponema sp.]|nr:nitrogenase [Treponema sp.]
MSISITTPEVQTRDHRLGTVADFHGAASRILELSNERKLGGSPRRFSQCSDCSQRLCEGQLYIIRGAAVVVHSPIGCCSPEIMQINSRVFGKIRGLEPNDVHVICSNISVKDTVYGGLEKLRIAIDEAKRRFNPTAIFIQSSCAAGIVGDDIESVADEKQDEYGIPIIPTYCEGFKSKTWASGFDASFHGILRKVVKPCRKRDENLVNVINFYGVDTFSPLLAKLNLKTNLILPHSTVEQLTYLSEALCTTQICETLGTYVCAALEEKFGVIQLKSNSPYGRNWTDEWIRALAKVSKREELGEEVIAKEHARIKDEFEKIRSELAGKKAYIFAGDSFSHIFAVLMHEFGLEVCGITSLHHDQVRDSSAEELNTLKQMIDEIGDVPNMTICNKQPFLMTKILKKYDVDILVSRHFNTGVVGTELGIPSLNVADPNSIMGYDGLLHFGRLVLKTIRAKNFYRTIGEHAKLPYSKWWIENPNPYHFGN